MNRSLDVDLAPVYGPFPSAPELVLRRYAELVDSSKASDIAFNAALSAMAPATRSAIVSDLKCYLGWCARRRPAVAAIPALPETLVAYLQWLSQGTETRGAAKPATLARRLSTAL